MERKKRKFRFRRRLRRPRIDFKRGLFLIPHFLTFSNAFLGFISLYCAATGNMLLAGYAILLGAIMDMLDGRLARYLGTTSDFGVQLDSLSDLITFCLAPAFLAYSSHLKSLGLFGLVSALFYLGAGMARLARFNLIHQLQTIFYLGLPSTMAGCFLTSFLLSTHLTGISYLTSLLLVLTINLLAVLMVSTLPFPTFKQHLFKHHLALHACGVGLIVVLLYFFGVIAVLYNLFCLYFVYAFFQAMRRRAKNRKAA